MKKKKLDSVTLLGVDCVDIDRLQLAADVCQEHFEFAEVKLLTSLPSKQKNIIPIEHISSTEEYSYFALDKLDAYVDTLHVLVIQYDGFILNPDAWKDDFLHYDYIGAPWLIADWSLRFGFSKDDIGKEIVGNGGFSLRSKRLLSFCARLSREGAFTTYHPEDMVICNQNRQLFVDMGIRFAPVEIARQFSFEGEHDVWKGQFGFHGLRWTDISRWLATHPEIKVDMKRNTIERISIT